MKILWISRHAPTVVQADTLSELLDVPVELTQYRATILGCHALDSILDEYQPCLLYTLTLPTNREV